MQELARQTNDDEDVVPDPSVAQNLEDIRRRGGPGALADRLYQMRRCGLQTKLQEPCSSFGEALRDTWFRKMWFKPRIRVPLNLQAPRFKALDKLQHFRHSKILIREVKELCSVFLHADGDVFHHLVQRSETLLKGCRAGFELVPHRVVTMIDIAKLADTRQITAAVNIQRYGQFRNQRPETVAARS